MNIVRENESGSLFRVTSCWTKYQTPSLIHVTHLVVPQSGLVFVSNGLSLGALQQGGSKRIGHPSDPPVH